MVRKPEVEKQSVRDVEMIWVGGGMGDGVRMRLREKL